MTISRIQLVSFFTLLAVLAPINAKPSTNTSEVGDECTALLKQFDAAMEKMLFFSDPAVPGFDSKDSFDSYVCKGFPLWAKSASQYGKCLKPFPKSLFNLVLTNVKKIHKQVCSSPDSVDIAWSHLKCIQNDTKESIIYPVQLVNSMLHVVASLESVDEMIPGLCCGVVELFEALPVYVDYVCKARTGPGTGQYISTLLNSILADLVDMMCGKFQTRESCVTNSPETFKKILDGLVLAQDHNETVAIPIVDILYRMDQVTI